MNRRELIVKFASELTNYFLECQASVIYQEIIALENNFYVEIEAIVQPTEDLKKVLQTIEKFREHPELKYYSNLATDSLSINDLYVLAPYITKIEYELNENSVKIWIFVKK